jgi:hypothetical protein
MPPKAVTKFPLAIALPKQRGCPNGIETKKRINHGQNNPFTGFPSDAYFCF